MKILLWFEIKKILQRKSTWITTGLLLGFLLLMITSNYFGSTYVEGEFLESHAEAIEITKENGRHLSGRKIDQDLLLEMQQAYAAVDRQDGLAYLKSEAYQKNARKYENIYNYIRFLRVDGSMDPQSVTEEMLYQGRQEGLQETWTEYGLTKAEKAYWKQQEASIQEPFEYQYAQGYSNILSMQGIYMVSMVMTFLVAICMSGNYTEEHIRKTDQLVLCTRQGRGKLYFIKIAAGMLVSSCIMLFYLAVSVILNLVIYGADGISAMIQLDMPFTSYQFTMGQVLGIAAGGLLVSNLMVTCITMVLGELMHSSIGSMAVMIAALFLARLFNVPLRYRIPSQIWNLLPINMLKIDQGLLDPRLIIADKIHVTAWQGAILLYFLIGVIFIAIGKKVYCNYQISGR